MKLGLLGPKQMAGTEPPLQQLQSRLGKLGLLELRSRAPRQSQNSRRLQVKLDLLGPGLAEAQPRRIEKLGVYFRAWTRVNALVEGTREVPH